MTHEPDRDASVSINEIWQARRRIEGIIDPTPLILSKPLSDLGQGSVWLKLEHLNAVGAFKLRGAANKLLSLSQAERSRGVATFSTGNHGLAVSYMAARLGITATVFVPTGIPDIKVENLKRFGAAVEIGGANQDEAAARCLALVKEKNLVLVPAFDDPQIIAGQGTAGLELIEKEPTVDTVLVPLSGGGLLAGVALAIKANSPSTKVIGISAENARAMKESVQAGEPISFVEQPTLADSLLGGIGLQNRYTFPLVRDLVDDLVLVSEKDIEKAMVYLLRHHRLIVEGAAAVGVAALLGGHVDTAGRSIAILITGCNVGLETVRKLFEQEAAKGAY